MADPSDAELLSAFGAGDVRAFETRIARRGARDDAVVLTWHGAGLVSLALLPGAAFNMVETLVFGLLAFPSREETIAGGGASLTAG